MRRPYDSKYGASYLTASAGVAPNKFLAKIASDWRKPNGQFVIQPHEAQEFLTNLAVGRIPGVGKVTEARMAKAGIKTVGDVFAMEISTLENHFGSYGQRLYELARGVDHSPVISNRARKQISAEDTFPEDLPLAACDVHICRLAEKVWAASKDNARQARTVMLKLKTREFSSLTRSVTSREKISACSDLVRLAFKLRERVDLPSSQFFGLVGVGLSNFEPDENSGLTSDDPDSGASHEILFASS